MVLYFNTALSKSDQNEVLKQFKNQAVLGLKSKMKNYNISVSRDRVVNGVVYIDYTYSFSDNKVYGTMYSRFADSKRFISTVAESLNANYSVVADINESLGF